MNAGMGTAFTTGCAAAPEKRTEEISRNKGDRKPFTAIPQITRTSCRYTVTNESRQQQLIAIHFEANSMAKAIFITAPQPK
jgi:hypothetical protein